MINKKTIKMLSILGVISIFFINTQSYAISFMNNSYEKYYIRNQINFKYDRENWEEKYFNKENKKGDIKLFSNRLLENIEREDIKFEPIRIQDSINFFNDIKRVYGNINEGPQTITTSKQLALLTSVNMTTNETGPIGITAAKLNNEDITLITLGGTEFTYNQATGIREDFLVAFEQANDYLRAIVKLFDEKDSNNKPLIPKDKPIVVAGISLGGMVAQQLLAQEDLVEEYDFRSIICFGSPLIAPTFRNDKTKVVRLCDEKDIVPHLGAIIILDEIRQEVENSDPSKYLEKLNKEEQKIENGGYKTFIGAHALSYVDNVCWNGYDVLGEYNGNNTITLKENMEFYDAPILMNRYPCYPKYKK